MKSIMCFFAASLVLIGCGDEKEEIKDKYDVVVLCDVSNSTVSQRSKGLANLKTAIRKIPKYYPIRTNFHYYPVSKNSISRRLADKVLVYDIDKSKQKSKQLRIMNQNMDRIDAELDSLVKITKNSCILTSVKRALDEFDELQQTYAADENDSDYHHKYELIIISDMIECCKDSENATINFNVNDIPQLKKAIAAFESKNDQLNVGALDLKVWVFINSPGVDGFYKDIEQAWKKWFQKIGVANVVFCKGGFFKKTPNAYLK